MTTVPRYDDLPERYWAYLPRGTRLLDRDISAGGGLSELPAGTVVAVRPNEQGTWAGVLPERLPGAVYWWQRALTPSTNAPIPQYADGYADGDIVDAPLSGGSEASLPFEDALTQPFTASGQTSDYHVWAAGLEPGAGLLVWLHGDGFFEHDNPTSDYVFGGPDGVVAKARERGYVTISAKTPSSTGTWWDIGMSRANYLLALLDHLRRGYATKPGRIILAGYSGGAQQATQYFMGRYAEALSAGGHVIAFAGGQRPDTTMSYSQGLKDRLPIRWIVGALDTGTPPENFDAVGISTTAQAWFAGHGFDAVLTSIPATGHDLDGLFGGYIADIIDGPA